LVAVDREEGRRLAAKFHVTHHRRAGEVAALGALDLDDLGAHVPETLGAERPRKGKRQVENPDAGKRSRRRVVFQFQCLSLISPRTGPEPRPGLRDAWRTGRPPEADPSVLPRSDAAARW